MTHGKNICKQLKEVRKRIAEENNIPLEMKECTYQGECRGTCPRCEAEVRYLENALADKLKFGRVATIAGLSLGLSACGGHVIQGEMPDDDTLAHPFADTIEPADPTTPVWREPQDIDPELIVCGGDFAVLPDTLTLNIDKLLDGEVANDYPMLSPEVEPQFPGGAEALYKFIEDNLRYPPLAAENNIGGRVFIQFVVDTDGTIQNPRILRDIGGGCGQEALRIVKLMPKWIPAKQDGKDVAALFTLAVTFDNKKNRIPILEGKPAVPLPPPAQGNAPDSVKVIVR